MANTLGTTVKGVTDTVGDTVGAVGKGVGDGVGALGTGVGNTVTGATSGIGDTTKAVGDTEEWHGQYWWQEAGCSESVGAVSESGQWALGTQGCSEESGWKVANERENEYSCIPIWVVAIEMQENVPGLPMLAS